jgi:isoleucyl-tRNA synthetase
LHRLYEIDQLVREASKTYNFQGLYTEIHNFCAVDLSAFYFDVRKDSLYCDDPKDPKRRATRTVMNFIFECLTSWLSPVLCFTSEEAWLARYPNHKGSIHTELFPSLSFEWNSPELAQKYEGLRDVRKVMTGALEVARASKQIGSSLQAQVEVFLNPSYMPHLEGVDLAELSITSKAVIVDTHTLPENGFQLEDVPHVVVLVNPAFGEKCARCWKVLPEVGEIKNFPDLCGRCADVVGQP